MGECLSQNSQAKYLQKTIANTENIDIEVQLLSNQIKNIKISIDTTGEQLKEKIYNDLSSQLPPRKMNLYYQGIKIVSNKAIKTYQLDQGQKLKIRQTKIDLSEVNGLNINPKGVDELTGQVGTAKMSCGHSIGRDSIILLIKSQISQNRYEIRCPNYINDSTKCRALWQFQICKKVGVLTRSQNQIFQIKLTQNYMCREMKQCPNKDCNALIIKDKLETNHVECPKCNSAPFCYLCLQNWKSATDSKQCGNKNCNFYDYFFKTCKMNVAFTLKDKKGITKTYYTPQYRACIHCSTVISHKQGCKHTKCANCHGIFCWVCLDAPKNSIYNCGGPFDYCGTIAGIQQINRRL